MSLSLHRASIPVFKEYLEALSGVLDKASAYGLAKKIDPAVLCATRLYPDMFGLARQVQITCDFAKNTAGRLAGLDPPKFEDHEGTLDELKARIRKTLGFVTNLDPKAIDASAGRDVVFPLGPNKMKMNAENYLLHFAMPNFFFHLTVAYAILRQCGVEIGKRDFLGNVPSLVPA